MRTKQIPVMWDILRKKYRDFQQKVPVLYQFLAFQTDVFQRDPAVLGAAPGGFAYSDLIEDLDDLVRIQLAHGIVARAGAAEP